MKNLADYEVVIGLEVHVQLNTSTKIFCSTPNSFGTAPNSLTDPVTLGLPGALPVLNKEVVSKAIMLGLSTNCQINRFTRFARKHYFYPDLPKGYQISQYEEPICHSGYLNLSSGSRIGITRIHMEEDAGKSTHSNNCSLIDYNRAGTPLLEVVSEPDLRSSKDAVEYLKQLHEIVTFIDVCDGNLEQGNFRCDANVSLRQRGATTFGTKTEIKNLNSFKFVEKAIELEINRQFELISDGQKVKQETVLFDTDLEITVVMRSKEEAADYRYFPDPDLPPLIINEEEINFIKSNLPELPEQKRHKYVSVLGLSEYDALVITSQKELAEFFENCIQHCKSPKIACNWLLSELLALKNRETNKADFKITPENFGNFIEMVESGKISGKIGKKLIPLMYETGEDPHSLLQKSGLQQISDPAEIRELLEKLVSAHASQFNELKNGKNSLKGFFVGQVMKSSNGRANPEIVNQELDKLIKGSSD